MMNLVKTLAIAAAMTIGVVAVAQEAAAVAPAAKAGVEAGKKGGKGAGWGQWKKNPDNVKRFDKNNDGSLSADEQTEAKAAWKKETGRGDEKGCKDCEKKDGKDGKACGKDGKGCEKDGKACGKDGKGCEKKDGKGCEMKDGKGCGKDGKGCEEKAKAATAEKAA